MSLPICAQDVFHNPFHVIIIGIQVIVAMPAMGINGYLLIKAYEERKKEISFMILKNVHLFFSFVHCGLLAAVHGFHIYDVLRTSTDCQLATPMWLCVLFRWPGSSCFAGYVIIHSGMIVERTIATWRRDKYHSEGRAVYWILGGLIIILCFWLPYLIYKNLNLSDSIDFCVGANERNFFAIISSNLSLCIIDVFNIACYMVLYKYNTAIQRRKTYKLRTSYQISENIYVIRTQIPLFWFHTIFLVVYGVTQSAIFYFRASVPSQSDFQIARAAIYILPNYDLLTPIFMLVLKDRMKRERSNQVKRSVVRRHEEGQHYFAKYEAMWK